MTRDLNCSRFLCRVSSVLSLIAYQIPLRIVTEIEKDGDLCVKAGNEQTEAVLCTKKATFTLKKTETSNTGMDILRSSTPTAQCKI